MYNIHLKEKNISAKSFDLKEENPLKMTELLERRPAQNGIKEMCDDKENPSKRISLQTFNSIGIQCSKLDEDLLTGSNDSKSSSYYWKLMAFKRRAALKETEEQNRKLDKDIDKLNEENILIREEIQCIREILEESDSFKESLNVNDSGFIDTK